MHVYDEIRLQGCSDFYSLVCKKDADAFLIRNVLLCIFQNSSKVLHLLLLLFLGQI